VTSTRSVVHAVAALVLAALLVGPSAHAGTPAPPEAASAPAQPASGQVDNEWLMMGRNCGASIS
jgi:hypothetical protein